MNNETTALARLAKVIAYPEDVPLGVRAFDFQVDGACVEAEEENGRLRLTRRLPPMEGEDELVRLAGYAVGRMLKEEAVLAWDPEAEAVILWQEISTTTSDALLRRFFEVFMTSCDWWTARTSEGTVFSRVPEMVIRP